MQFSLEVKNGHINITSNNKDFKYIIINDHNTYTKNSDGVISIDFLNFNPFEDTIFSENTIGKRTDLSYLFSKFNTYTEENSENFNNIFVHSKLRKFSGEELLFLCMSHLKKYCNPEKKLTLISIIAYRISEDLENLSYYLDFVYNEYLKCLREIDLYNPLNYRWFISSSTPLSICLIENNLFDEALMILSKVLEHVYLTFTSPLTFWNVTVCFHLYALLCFQLGQKEKSIAMFMASFNFTRSGYNELFHAKNEWLFSQYYDLDALIKLSKNSLASANILSNGKFNVESKFSTPKAVNMPKSDINILLQRYPNILKSKKCNIRKMFYKLNRYNDE